MDTQSNLADGLSRSTTSRIAGRGLSSQSRMRFETKLRRAVAAAGAAAVSVTFDATLRELAPGAAPPRRCR